MCQFDLKDDIQSSRKEYPFVPQIRINREKGNFEIGSNIYGSRVTELEERSKRRSEEVVWLKILCTICDIA